MNEPRHDGICPGCDGHKNALEFLCSGCWQSLPSELRGRIVARRHTTGEERYAAKQEALRYLTNPAP